MRIFLAFLISFPFFGYGGGHDSFRQYRGTASGGHGESSATTQGSDRGERSGRWEFRELNDLLRCDRYAASRLGYDPDAEKVMTAGCKRKSAVDEACPGAVENIFEQYRRLGGIEQQLNHFQDAIRGRQLYDSLNSHRRAIYQSLCRCKGNIERKYADLRQSINLPERRKSYNDLKIDEFIETHGEDQSKSHIVSLAKEAQRQFELLKKEHIKCFDIHAGPHGGNWPPESGGYSDCRVSQAFELFKQTAGYAAECVSLDGIHAAYLKALKEYEREQGEMTRSGQLSQCDKSKCADKLKEWLKSAGPHLGLFEICGKGFSDSLSCCGSLDCSGDHELSAMLDAYIRGDASFQKACGGSAEAYQEALASAAHAQREICPKAEEACNKECGEALGEFQDHFKECFDPGKSIRNFLQEAEKAGKRKEADDCQISALEVRDLYLKELREFHKKQAAAAGKLPGLSQRESQSFHDRKSRLSENDLGLSEKSSSKDIINCSLIRQEPQANPAQANPAQANSAPANLASAVQRICQERYGASQYPNQYPGQSAGQYPGQSAGHNTGQYSGQNSSQRSGRGSSSSSYSGSPRSGSAPSSSNTGSQPSSALSGSTSGKPSFVQPEFGGELSSPDLSKKGLFPNSKDRGPSSDSASGGLPDIEDFAGGSFSGGDDGSGAFGGAGADAVEAAGFKDLEGAEDDGGGTVSEESLVMSKTKRLQLKAKSIGSGFVRKARKLFRLGKRKKNKLGGRAPDLKFNFRSGGADSESRFPAGLKNPLPPLKPDESLFDRHGEILRRLCEQRRCMEGI